MPTFHPHLPDHATVRSAFLRLEPDTPGRWGTLDATGMLEHCARFNETYLGRRKVSWMVRILGRLLGGVFVKKFLSDSPFAMKRGMGTLPSIRVEPSDADAAGFEDARGRLLATLDEIGAIRGTWDHPLYGRMDAEKGKALVRHHCTHHLHQFGVLDPPSEE